MDLDSMKYAELRSLAKELGLKANMKADKLLKLIKQHYQQEKNMAEEEQQQDKDSEVAAVQEDEKEVKDGVQENEEEISSTALFVNTRRGRRNGGKRKISDITAETECDAQMPPPTGAQVDAEVAVATASSGGRGAKKRKVSTDKTEPPEEQRDTVDEAPVQDDTGKATQVVKACKIPRSKGLQQKNKALKPVTPNFKKLHEAHFNKMESIDSYVQRKTKQIDAYRNSVKELKNLADKTKQQKVGGKTPAEANATRASMFSPAPANKAAAAERRRHTMLSASKAPPGKPAPAKEGDPFRPSVLSTRRINVRFSEATRDNEHKRSLVKTPARMSPCVASSTPQREAAGAVKPNVLKTSVLSATKTPGPFVFTGNTSTSATPGTQKKPTFDLKASLSRPLTYKPHTGKLKPFGEAKENPTAAGNKSLISSSHQKNYKQHQVQTREDRRAKHTENRKQKKENMLGARRGLVMM